jgi:hypothetical protein
MNSSLAEALEKLGFDSSLHTSIATYISLQLPKFTIQYNTVKERDVIKFNLFFERKEAAYSCLCYDAFLRKEIVLKDVVINNIHLRELDEQMSSIDWKGLFKIQQDITSIIDNLQTLASSMEGKEFSEQLKVKYWSDTPLESIMNVSLLKSRFEISQRFYFLEDGKGISIEEAYRFLNNRWMERQLRKEPAIVAPPVQTKTKSKKSKSPKS